MNDTAEGFQLSDHDRLEICAALRHLARHNEKAARACLADQEYRRLMVHAYRLASLAMTLDPRNDAGYDK